MSTSPLRKQQFSVSLDADLVDQVDQLTSDRDQAIEEGLQLWCAKLAEKELHKYAQARQQRHDRDETGWLV